MSEPEPKLAPPGAGIPFYQKLFLRLYVNPFVAGREPLEKMRARIERKHLRVREEYLAVPEKLRDRKVLVPPQTGLDDSSRYWSAAMVLEHLEIVGSQMGEGIVHLTNGRSPKSKADTAKVKPRGALSAFEIFGSFDGWQSGFLARLDSGVKDFDAKGTYDHPWFGPFTARKWLWVLGIHADIHLKQLRAIRKILDAKT